MGQSQSKSDETPKPGDLIEMPRGTYNHWAVYVGDGDVVHVTSPPGAEVPGIVSNIISAPSAALSSLGSVPTEKAMVRREKLEEAVGNNEWRINNNLDKKYEPRSASIIVDEALGQVGNMMEYSVLSENCEHFATNLRYRKHESQQVHAAVQTAKAAAPFALLGAIATAAFTVGVHGRQQTYSSTSPPVKKEYPYSN